MQSSILSPPSGEAAEGDGAGAPPQPQPFQRTERIRAACAISSELRTDQEIGDILAFVATVSFFPQLTRLQQQSLCQRMTLETRDTNDKVITRGERGDKFYIILSGSVAIHAPRKGALCQTSGCSDPDYSCPSRPMEIMNFLHPGAGFGELALQSDEPRAATVVCSARSEFLVITRADYQTYVNARHREFLSERLEFLKSCPCIREALLAGGITDAEVAVMANLLHEVSLNGHDIACKQGDEVSEVIFVRSGQLLKVRAVDAAAHGSIANSPRSPSKVEQKGAMSQSMVKMKELFTVKRKARQRSAILKLGTKTFHTQSVPAAPAAAASKWAILRSVPRQGWQAGNWALRRSKLLEERIAGEFSSQDAAAGPQRSMPDAIETPSEAPNASEFPTPTGSGRRHMLLSAGVVGPFESFGDHQLFLGERHAVSLISNPVAKLYTMNKDDVLKLPKGLLSHVFGQRAMYLPDDRHLLAMYRRGKKWDDFRKGVYVQNRPCANADSNLEFLGVSGGADVERVGDGRLPADGRRVSLTLEDAEDFSQSPASFLHRFHGMRCDRVLRDHCARERLRYDELGQLWGSEQGGEADIRGIQLEMQWSHVQGAVFADLEADLDAAAEIELASSQSSAWMLPPAGAPAPTGGQRRGPPEGSPWGGSPRSGSPRGSGPRRSSGSGSGSGSQGPARPAAPLRGSGGARRPQPQGPRGAATRTVSPAGRSVVDGQWLASPRRRPAPSQSPRRGAPRASAAQMEATLLPVVAAADVAAWRVSPRSARQKTKQPRSAPAETAAPWPSPRYPMLPLIAPEAACLPGGS